MAKQLCVVSCLAMSIFIIGTTYAQEQAAPVNLNLPVMTVEKADSIASEAKNAVGKRDFNRAIALYTKLLQHSGHELHESAQEYLGLARERNGQIAHAKAEYEKFLALYPKAEGSLRVKQRLSALLAVDPTRSKSDALNSSSKSNNTASQWSTRAYVSQYYRRHRNQFNDLSPVVSQSAILNNIDVVAKRKGQRFEIQTRLNSGYYLDFLPKDEGPGDSSRLSLIYVDIRDRRSLIRTRVGRQSRRRGGVLGRFDGFHFSRPLSKSVELNFVAGYPVSSSTDGLESDRRFQGFSIDFGPYAKNWNFSLFYNAQKIGDIDDRKAIGGEFRYVDSTRSMFGSVDYDLGYKTLNSVYLHSNWRVSKMVTFYGLISNSHSPYLTTQNALIGQAVADIDELQALFTEDEIRQLALDRSPKSTALNAGVSKKIGERNTISLDANTSRTGASKESGNVPAIAKSDSNYVSASLFTSKLFASKDSGVATLRFYNYSTADGVFVSFDYRFPFGNGYRISPRIRLDKRTYVSDDSEQTLLSIALRIRRQWRKKLTFEFEIGNEVANRDRPSRSEDRTSFFVNAGYRYSFR